MDGHYSLEVTQRMGTFAALAARMGARTTVIGFSFMIPALSMWAAIGKFVEDHARLPEDAERGRLMTVGLVVTTVITLVGLAGLAPSMGLGTGALVAIFLVCLLVNWASLRTGIRMARNLPATVCRPRR